MGTDPYQRLLDEARLGEAAGQRNRHRSLATQLIEDATVAGVLTDLLERGELVSLRTRAGTTRVGVPLAVSTDHLVLGTGAGERVLVALEAVADVRPAPDTDHGAAASDRRPPLDRTLIESLARAAEEGRTAQIGYLGGAVAPVHGHLEAVGRDVVTVRHGDRRVYVRIDSIAEVVLGG